MLKNIRMKKNVFIISFLFMTVMSFAQEKVGGYTMHGTSYEVAAFIDKTGTLVTLVRVLGKYESDEVIIKIDSEDNLLSFVQALKKTKAKFIEWKNVAKKNNVKDFIKEMGIVYPKVQICWFGVTELNFSFIDDYVKMKFIVSDDGLDIYFGTGGTAKYWDNEYIEQEWYMLFYNIDEIQSLIDVLNPQKIKNVLNSAANVDGLFK